HTGRPAQKDMTSASNTGTRRFRSSRILRSIVNFLNQLHVPITVLTRPVFRLAYAVHVGARESSIALLRFLWWEPLFRSRCARVGPRLQMEKLPYMTGAGRIVIGSNVRLSGKSSIGFGTRWHETPELFIGNHTFVGHNCSFLVAKSITIG